MGSGLDTGGYLEAMRGDMGLGMQLYASACTFLLATVILWGVFSG